MTFVVHSHDCCNERDPDFSAVDYIKKAYGFIETTSLVPVILNSLNLVCYLSLEGNVAYLNKDA